jgi:hypothetical protein
MTLANTVERLKEHWAMIFPEAPVPADKEWALWLLANDEESVRQALTALAMRVATGKRHLASADLHKFVMGILIRAREDKAKIKDTMSVNMPVAGT